MLRPRTSDRFRHLPAMAWCVTAAFALMRVQWQLEGEPNLAWRTDLHHATLAHTAATPYMEHMFLISQVAEWLRVWASVDLSTSFMLIQGAAYLVALVGTAYLLATLGLSRAATLAGVVVVTAYAGLLLQYSAVQPADGFAAGLFAVTLALAQREQVAGLIAVSVATSFVSLKQVLLGPALLLLYGLEGRVRRWPVAVAAGLSGAVWMVVCPWLFGPREVPGVVTFTVWIAQIPKAALYHASIAAVPLWCAWRLRARLAPVLVAGLSVYPMLLVVYFVKLQFIYELRSFWIVVPVFAALISQWIDAEQAAH